MLEGVVVLDCSRLLPGPFATRWLVALGARVIRVEAPGGEEGDGNPLEAVLGAGKARVVVDLKTPAGRQDFLKLAERADVVVESFRPGVTARLGIDYDTLQRVNPGLVYVSLTGWGQTGPLARRAAHDINYLAVAGFFGLTRDPAGRPVLPGTQVADLVGSVQAVVGILAALWERERTGRGRYLDVAMLDGAVAWQVVFLAPFLAGGPPPGPGSHALLGRYVCYNFYRTAEGRWMSLGALEPKFWAAFVEAVDRPAWRDQQWAPADGRGIHREIADLFAAHEQAWWTALGEQADCCLFPVLEPAEAWDHPQVRERVAAGPAGRSLRFPLETTPPTPPELYDLLRTWGWSPEAIRRLVDRT